MADDVAQTTTGVPFRTDINPADNAHSPVFKMELGVTDEFAGTVGKQNPLPITFPLQEHDAFGRLRVSNPETIFDSKQIFDAQALFWDDQQETGSGTTSTYSQDAARSRLAVALNTAGKRTRQTFMRFNYQPGKSQQIMLTGVLTSGAAAGVKSSMGLFDDDNGIFLAQDGITTKLVIRSSVTGSAVDTEITQDNWNIDQFDGTGPSGVTLDFTQTQIFMIDFEWLGVGTVRAGFVINGELLEAHEFYNANTSATVYMSTPNLPLRYQIENDGTGAATTMDHICSTVISEGGNQDLGVLRYVGTNGAHVDANAADTHYALIGIRLKTGAIGATVRLVSESIISETNDDFEWTLRLNPSVAGTFTYSDQTNSVVQTALGATANTVTGGTILAGGLGKSSSELTAQIGNALRLGVAIDGTRDSIVLCVRPLSSNADYEAGLVWRELS